MRARRERAQVLLKHRLGADALLSPAAPEEISASRARPSSASVRAVARARKSLLGATMACAAAASVGSDGSRLAANRSGMGWEEAGMPSVSVTRRNAPASARCTIRGDLERAGHAGRRAGRERFALQVGRERRGLGQRRLDAPFLRRDCPSSGLVDTLSDRWQPSVSVTAACRDVGKPVDCTRERVQPKGSGCLHPGGLTPPRKIVNASK